VRDSPKDMFPRGTPVEYWPHRRLVSDPIVKVGAIYLGKMLSGNRHSIRIVATGKERRVAWYSIRPLAEIGELPA
jgi:hypothetical protein